MKDRIMADLKEETFAPIRGTIVQVVAITVMTSKISVDVTESLIHLLSERFMFTFHHQIQLKHNLKN